MAIFSSLYGTRLDRELGTDDSTQLFTTARRKSAINEAQEEFADLTECLKRRLTLTLTGGTGEYDINDTGVLPAGDFVRWSDEQVQVRYTDASSQVTVLVGDDLPKRTVMWLDHYQPGWEQSTVASTTMQLPGAYYERIDGGHRYLGFTPVPSTGSSASMVALVPYLARPAAMTSDTSEPFTVNSSQRTDLRPFHQALVHYAASQLEKLRRDPEASEKQMQIFRGYVTRFVASMRVKGGRQVTFARHVWRSMRSGDRGTDPRR